jgi:hypothetical protein
MKLVTGDQHAALRPFPPSVLSKHTDGDGSVAATPGRSYHHASPQPYPYPPLVLRGSVPSVLRSRRVEDTVAPMVVVPARATDQDATSRHGVLAYRSSRHRKRVCESTESEDRTAPTRRTLAERGGYQGPVGPQATSERHSRGGLYP